MFEQLRQNYLASFTAKIENLERALAEKNAQALTSSIHQLAGSSGSYGFEDIAVLCHEIESTSPNDDAIDAAMVERTKRLISLMSEYSKSS